MNDKSFCRIAIFYDGSYFNYAQRYFWRYYFDNVTLNKCSALTAEFS